MTVIIKVGENVVGSAENLEEVENPDRELDSDARDFKLERVSFDKIKLSESFVNDKVAVASQHYPLQITHELEDGSIVTYYNAWITAMNYSSCDENDWYLVDLIECESEGKSK